MIQTYVVFSRGLYKIGKSKSFESRIKALRTANPDIELCYLINADVEKELHHKFQYCRYKNEWFKLEEQDLLHIEQDYFNFFNKKEPDGFAEIESWNEYKEMKNISNILLWLNDKLSSQLFDIISEKLNNYENKIIKNETRI